MHENKPNCPQCAQGFDLDHWLRRDFIKAAGGGVAAAAGVGALAASPVRAAPAAKKPAEDLIRELHASLSDDQKKELVLPWNHGADKNGANPSRLKTYNGAVLGKRIGEVYTKPQQELVKRTLRAILSSDEALERVSRNGKWDNSGSFEGNGAVIFGDPTGDEKFSWVFAGHHLTLRCDGNSEPAAAFGGPMYYGHIVNGYRPQNVYYYQTEQVKSVFDALDEKQRGKAVVVGSPGDRDRAIRFRAAGEARPGLGYAEMSGDQQKLVQSVMRTLLAPFRQEDGDEVMQLLKTNGGLEKLHLAFYKDSDTQDNERWHYWRLEGPGFIWNYRVLPHVHCYVNIAGQA